MRRLLSLLAALATLTPAPVVLTMVQTVPQSALTVPKVHIASTGEPIRIDPGELGASRTADGLEISEEKLEQTLRDIADRFNAPPVAGEYLMTDDGPAIRHGVPGYAVDIDATRTMLIEALRGQRNEITLPVVEVPSAPPPPFAIVVRLSQFRLDLYEGNQHRKSYTVGVGALRFPTPPGAYYVRSKAKNPTWRNPGSPWARNMPRHIGPGPKNPLGSRALRLDRGALVIHGTPNEKSVGHRSSHGCMRMYRIDVEELFEIVPTGTPVYIVP